MAPAITASQLRKLIPNIRSGVDPNTIAACEPTLTAPIVFAMVFKDRIAARGRSTSALNSDNSGAKLAFSISFSPT